MEQTTNIVNGHLQIEVTVKNKQWKRYLETIKNESEEPTMLRNAFAKLKASMVPQLYLKALENQTIYFQNNAYIITINTKFVIFVVKFKLFAPIPKKLFHKLQINFKPTTFNLLQTKNELKKIVLDATPSLLVPNYRIQKKDYVIINLRGFLESRPVSGWHHNKLRIQVGHSNLLQAIDDALVGMLVNETKEITVTLAQNHANAWLRNKIARFQIKIFQVLDRSKTPRLDDNFVKRLDLINVQNETQLSKHITFVLQEQTIQTNLTWFADLFFKKVLPHLDFEIPDWLIDQTVMAMRLEKQMVSETLLFTTKQTANNDSIQTNEDFLAIEKIKKNIVLDDIGRQVGIIINNSNLEQGWQMMASAKNITLQAAKMRFPKLIMRKILLNRRVIEYLITKNNVQNRKIAPRMKKND